MGRFEIREDDLSSEAVRDLLRLHLAGMHASSPPGHVFALDLSGLKAHGVTVWTAWDGERVAAIGALKVLPDGLMGEVKSMRTHPDYLRQGAAAAILDRIIEAARAKDLRRLALETGRGGAFEAALALYRERGFVAGGAFAGYKPGAFSQFFHLDLREDARRKRKALGREPSPPPPAWRLWTGLTVAPGLPIIILVFAMDQSYGLSKPGDALGWLLPVVIVVVLWAPLVGAGALLYVLTRKTVRRSWLACALGGMMVMPVVPVVVTLMASSFEASDIGALIAMMMLASVAGAIVGVIFWLIAQAGVKPPPGPEQHF